MRHRAWRLGLVVVVVSALCLCLCLLPSAAAETPHSSSSLPTYYEILESSSSSSAAELKRAYRRLALVLHPDKAASASEAGRRDAEAAFIALSAAYEVLSDAVLRPRYDYLLTQHVHVYDDHIRDWAAFDPETGSFSRQRTDTVVAGDGRFSFGGGGGRSYESARERWEREQAEEEREKRALIIALLLSLGVALLPLFFFYWRRLSEAAASRRRKEEASEKLRQEQAALVEYQHEKKKEDEARREEERSRREELRRRREEQEREEDDDDDEDGGKEPDKTGENGPSEGLAAFQGDQGTGNASGTSALPSVAAPGESVEPVEEEEDDRPRRRGAAAAGDGSPLSCDICRKKFKSQQQSAEQLLHGIQRRRCSPVGRLFVCLPLSLLPVATSHAALLCLLCQAGQSPAQQCSP